LRKIASNNKNRSKIPGKENLATAMPISILEILIASKGKIALI
jgi:hypothetical protein